MTSNVSQVLLLLMITSSPPLPVPPFGADQDEDIKSIFEVEHLHPSIWPLSIQCEFISVVDWVFHH